MKKEIVNYGYVQYSLCHTKSIFLILFFIYMDFRYMDFDVQEYIKYILEPNQIMFIVLINIIIIFLYKLNIYNMYIRI